MDDFTVQFNNILVRAYHNVLLMEETKRKHSRTTTSFRGRNAMEFLYKSENGEKKISEIAEYLRITRPSATSLINKLEALDYVTRSVDKHDERSAIISLTRRGRLVTALQIAHRNKVSSRICEEFTDEEKQVLYKGFCRLNEVFEECIDVMENTSYKNNKKDKEK